MVFFFLFCFVSIGVTHFELHLRMLLFAQLLKEATGLKLGEEIHVVLTEVTRACWVALHPPLPTPANLWEKLYI